MKAVQFFFLAVFAAWAVPVVAHDLATRKITNASIKTGLKLLAAGLAVFALYTGLGYAGWLQGTLPGRFYGLFLIHLFWTLVTGIALWYGGVWPAGDAKFFMLLSAALPLANPHLRGFPNYLFLIMLINVFVMAALWAVGSFVATGFSVTSAAAFFSKMAAGMRSRLAGLVTNKSRFAAAGYMVTLPFLFLLQQIFMMEARGVMARFLFRTEILFFFVFILWEKIGACFRSKRWIYLMAACYLAYCVFGLLYFREHLWLLLSNSLKNMLRFSMLLLFGRFLLAYLLEKKDTLYLTAAELEPGAVLSEDYARMLRKNALFEGEFDDNFKDGLTVEQVELLRSWLAKVDKPDTRVEVVRGRPFALWIFIGAAISLVFSHNLGTMFR